MISDHDKVQDRRIAANAKAIESLVKYMREVRDHEPFTALDGGPDGMDCYRLLFRHAPRWLKPGGLLILEMGSAAQAEAFRLSPPAGFAFLREFRDEGENPRCAVWRYFG